MTAQRHVISRSVRRYKTNGYNLVQGEGAEQNKIAYTSGSSSVDVSSEAVTIMTVKYTVNRGIETAANVSVGTKDGYFAPTGADTDIAAVSTAETVNLYNLKVTLSSGDGNTVTGSPAAYYTKYNTGRTIHRRQLCYGSDRYANKGTGNCKRELPFGKRYNRGTTVENKRRNRVYKHRFDNRNIYGRYKSDSSGSAPIQDNV